MVAAAVAAVATVGAAAISSSANKKAAKTAAGAADRASAESNALQREIYQKNTANISPWMTRGNAAGAMQASLLGIGGPAGDGGYGGYGPQGTTPANPLARQPLPGQSTNVFARLSEAAGLSQGGAMGAQQFPGLPGIGNRILDMTPEQRQQWSQAFQAWKAQQAGGGVPAGGGPATGGPPGVPQGGNSQLNAFDTFRNSTGYQFRMDEGAKGVNALYAGKGLLESGAAAKAMQRYAQDYGSNEFGRYYSYLGDMSQQGLGGANALAGVGSNYANASSANNWLAADARGNAALAGASNTNSLLGSALQGVGMWAGSRQSSYGGGAGGSIGSGGLTDQQINWPTRYR